MCGGEGPDDKDTAVVEIMVEEVWSSLQPLPIQCSRIKSIIHHRNLYLMGGSPYKQRDYVFYCKLDSLLDKEFYLEKDISQSSGLWKYFSSVHTISCSSSFMGHLVSTGGMSVSPIADRSCKIRAFSPLSHSWVHVGDVPRPLVRAGTIVLPTGELVVVGGTGIFPSYSVHNVQ